MTNVFFLFASLLDVTFTSGIILVGPSGSGKSACVQALIDALCVNGRGLSRNSQSRSTGSAQHAEHNHRLQKLNPCVVDDYDSMFGYINQQNDWVDGIFTHIFRKANRVGYRCSSICYRKAMVNQDISDLIDSFWYISVNKLIAADS